MFESMIMEPSEKIRYLKDEFHLTQKQLVGEEADCSNISNIIGGHQPLSERMAFVISRSFQLATSIYVSPEELLEPVKEQVERIVQSNINELLLSNNEDSINVAVTLGEVLNTYKVNNELLFRAYEVLLNFYIKSKAYSKLLKTSVSASIKAKKKGNAKRESQFILKSVVALIELKKFEAAMIELEYLEMNENAMLEYGEYIHYNKALIHIENECYIECIKELDTIQFKNKGLHFKSLLLRSNCCAGLLKYSEAIKQTEKYIEIARIEKKTDEMSIGYRNLCEFYNDIGDKEKSNLFKHKRLIMQSNYNKAEHLYYFFTIAETIEEKYDLLCKASEAIIKYDFENKQVLEDVHNSIIKVVIEMNNYGLLKQWIDMCYQHKINLIPSHKHILVYMFNTENNNLTREEIIRKI